MEQFTFLILEVCLCVLQILLKFTTHYKHQRWNEHRQSHKHLHTHVHTYTHIHNTGMEDILCPMDLPTLII